jgi:Tfp pilus assembly protein PilN
MSTEITWKQIPEPEDADLSKLLNQIKLNDLQSRHPLEQLRKNFLMNIIWGIVINSGYIVLLWAYPLWQLFMTIGLVFLAGVLAIVQGVMLYRSLNRSVSSKAPLLDEMKRQYTSISKIIKQQELYFLIIYPFAGAGGFMLGGMIGSGRSIEEFLSKTVVWISMLIIVPLIATGGHYLGKWLNKVAFGKHIRQLKANIDALEAEQQQINEAP